MLRYFVENICINGFQRKFPLNQVMLVGVVLMKMFPQLKLMLTDQVVFGCDEEFNDTHDGKYCDERGSDIIQIVTQSNFITCSL